MAAALAGIGDASSGNVIRSGARRGQCFLWTTGILVANALIGPALADAGTRSLASSALNLFGISAFYFVALLAALVLVREDKEQTSRLDWFVIAVCLVTALLPNYTLARFLVSALGVYLIFSSSVATSGRRAGIIVVALGGALFWGPVMLFAMGHPVLELDAKLTSWLYGFDRVGNTINFTDGTPGGIIIAPGCSSWHGLSLAILFWITIQQWFATTLRAASFLWLALALLATIFVNNLRLAALAAYPEQFEMIHHGYGATIAGWTTMILVVSICLFGERRAIFPR